ncbi:MAG: FadR/GntR family transcriptional regulator [Nocardioides sp.]|uniref:FadR/GntR family transcriptional regulator n=1 Tax=Nocardioides sp. TaxID=35761 RepID=UPI003EFEB867
MSNRPGIEIISERVGGGASARPVRRKASEEVAAKIVDQVVADGLTAGTRLPPEADMIVQFGVSRETLREALRLLEVQGFLSIRRGPGGGPTLEAVNAGFLARSASLYFHLAGASYAEVLQAWQLMEPPLAARAAGNPDRATVRELMGPYLDPGASPDSDVSEDDSFHAAIAQLSGNKVVQLLTRTVGHLVTDQVMAALPVRVPYAEARSWHAEAAEAIVRGHKRRAYEAVDGHIAAVIAYYDTHAADRMGDPVLWA